MHVKTSVVFRNPTRVCHDRKPEVLIRNKLKNSILRYNASSTTRKACNYRSNSIAIKDTITYITTYKISTY